MRSLEIQVLLLKMEGLNTVMVIDDMNRKLHKMEDKSHTEDISDSSTNTKVIYLLINLESLSIQITLR